jgi:hypothetical protein
MSELLQILQTLKQPEYAHVLLNPLPVYGLAMGLLALVFGLLVRNAGARLTGLALVAVACLSVWPVAQYGHRGYDRVYAMSNDDAREWLDAHAGRAGRGAYVYYAAGLAALAAIAAPRKFPKASPALTAATLALAVAALGAGGWISHAGGQVRHPEFREGPPAVRAEQHHRGGAGGHEHAR